MRLIATVFGAAILIASFTVIAQAANQQPPTQTAQAGSQQPAARQASAAVYPEPHHGAKRIGFRAAVWRTLHIHDVTEAHTTLEVLKKIGCDVAQNQHNGHLDVRFLCKQWKSLPVPSDMELAKWQSWLTDKGLETVVLNPSDEMNVSRVRFRLSSMQSTHIHDAARVKSLTELYQMIGCDVRTHEHNGHTDITVRCPQWVTIGLINCQQAHQWQDWLKQNGFETQHEH